MDVSPKEQEDGDSDVELELECEIEDVEAELEEFVRLNHTGQFNDAHELFDECLVDHVDWFPVAAEFADCLLREGKFSQLEKFLSEVATKFPTPGDRDLLEAISIAARIGVCQSNKLDLRALQRMMLVSPFVRDLNYDSSVKLTEVKWKDTSCERNGIGMTCEQIHCLQVILLCTSTLRKLLPEEPLLDWTLHQSLEQNCQTSCFALLGDGHLWESQRILQSLMYCLPMSEGMNLVTKYIQIIKDKFAGQEAALVALSSLVQRILYQVSGIVSTPLTTLQWNDAVTWALFDVAVVNLAEGSNPPFSWFCLRRLIEDNLAFLLPLVTPPRGYEEIDVLVETVEKGDPVKLEQALSATTSKFDKAEVRKMALIEAAKKPSNTAMDQFIDQSTVNATDGFQRTALHLASFSTQRQARMVKALLKKGANPDSMDWFERTALHYAVASPPAMNIAMQISARSYDPHYVLETESLAIIKSLISHDQNLIHKRDAQGLTPLDVANKYGSPIPRNELLQVFSKENDTNIAESKDSKSAPSTQRRRVHHSLASRISETALSKSILSKWPRSVDAGDRELERQTPSREETLPAPQATYSPPPLSGLANQNPRDVSLPWSPSPVPDRGRGPYLTEPQLRAAVDPGQLRDSTERATPSPPPRTQSNLATPTVMRDRSPRWDDPPSSSRQGREGNLNEFFVDGKGIHREILQQEISKYLGPDAYSKPSTYDGVPGYTIFTHRPFTSKMLDDLQELSRSYEAENRRAFRRGHQGIPYENSAIHQEAIRNRGPDDDYEQVGYPRNALYTTPSGQPSYLASTRVDYTASQPGGYAGSIYPPGSSYIQGSSYANQQSIYSGSVRPGIPDPYNIPYDPYTDESPRPMYPGGARREVRFETRPDQRDPRLEFRPDPRPYVTPDYRIDPRDPRADPRMMPSYAYPPTMDSLSDPVRGYYDDYVSAPSALEGRGGGSYARSRASDSGYGSSRSSRTTDVYGPQPRREERKSEIVTSVVGSNRQR